MLLQRGRGNVLMIVLVLVFLATTLVLALFQVTSLNFLGSLRTEADLEARQLARFRTFQVLKGQSLQPDFRPAIRLQQEEDDHLLEPLAAASLFRSDDRGWSGLGNSKAPQSLSYDSELKGYIGHRYLRFRRARGDAGQGVVTAREFPWAVLAVTNSAQAVTMDQLVSWKNPLFGTNDDSLQALASLPPAVLSPGGVRIDDMPAGEVLSAQSARLQSRAPMAGAVAFQLPEVQSAQWINQPQKVAQRLRQQIQGFRQNLVSVAQSVDKTQLFRDDMSPGDSLAMFFTSHALPGKYRDHLSLRQSQAFWLPTIPGFTRQFFIIYHLIFHIPDRPDGGLNDLSRRAQSVLSDLLDAVRQLEKAIDALKSAEDAVASARDWLDSHMDCGSCKWPWNWPCCGARELAKGALYVAQGALIAAEQAVSLAEQAVLVILSPIIDALEAILVVSGQMPIPVSRNDEAGYRDRTGVKIDTAGMDNWAYRSVFNGIGNVVSDLFSGDFNKVGRDFGHDLSLVFFGQGDKQSRFDCSSAISARATMNVPAGRSLYLGSSLSLQGDLWLGRGSSLVILGDLTLAAGDTPTGGGTAPSGRLFLEEGARLSVTGSLRCAGSLEEGSIVVAGPLGEVHATTSAIFCGRDLVAPFGIFPGVAADQLATLVPPAAPVPTAVTTTFGPLLRQLAPNLAKVNGPFRRRLPYIARYATTFEWIALDDPLPFIIPENFGNLMVPVMRGLSALYAPTLNFELGENFLTHCDWWGQKGEGRVPILLKPVGAALGANAVSGMPIQVSLSNALTTRAGQIGSAAVDRFSNHLCIALAAEWAKAIIAGTGVPLVSWGKLISTAIDYIDKDYYNLGDRERSLDAVISDAQLLPLRDLMSQFWQAVQAVPSYRWQQLLQECPGLLVYSGGAITVGTSGAPARLAVAWFVGEGDISLWADYSAGAIASLGQGRVQTGKFFYLPSITRVSLFTNVAETSDWLERGKQAGYASDDGRTAQQKAVDLGGTERVVWSGWGGSK